MAMVAEFPIPPHPVGLSTQLRLSVIVGEIGKLLVEAAALQHARRPDDARSQAELIVRMQSPGFLEKAGRAAEIAARQHVHGACDEVAKAWETHTDNWFLLDRLAEVEKNLDAAGMNVLLTYHRCLRTPEMFCECGRMFNTQIEAARTACHECAVRRSRGLA